MAEETTDILTVIAEITAKEAGVEASAISRESRFAADLDIDSLGLLTITRAVGRARSSRRSAPGRAVPSGGPSERPAGSEPDHPVLARRGQDRLDDGEGVRPLGHGDVLVADPAHGVAEALLLQGQGLALGDGVVDDVALADPAKNGDLIPAL